MTTIDVDQLGPQFRDLLTRVAEGETIIVLDNHEPIAEIHAPEAASAPRRIGLAKTSFSVPASFFEPLPDDVVDLFDGDDR